MDTNAQFNLSRKSNLKNNLNIRFAKTSDEADVRSIAKNAFEFSRFYKDPNISNYTAV